MNHLTKEEICRSSEGGWTEIEQVAAHLAVCRTCRALALGLQGERPFTAKSATLLKVLIDLATFEKGIAVERLLARAKLGELLRLTRGAQKERVILSRACHSPSFLDALLGVLRVPQPREKAQSVGNLALLATQGMDADEGNAGFKNDRLAAIWIETANLRRIRGEWQAAGAALLRADGFSTTGTGDPNLRSRYHSIVASLLGDQGRWDPAMVSLDKCRKIHTDRNDWPLVGQVLIKMANCVTDYEPAQALAFLDQARIYVASDEFSLRSDAERIRTDCLMVLGRLQEALCTFAESERLQRAHVRPNADLRSNFIAARLLEGIGYTQHAEVLFDAVVSDALDRGLIKDAVLDLFYIFGFHVRLGSIDHAAGLGQRVLDELDRRGVPVHEQLRLTLAKIVAAAHNRCLDELTVREARENCSGQDNRASPSAPKPVRDLERLPSHVNRLEIDKAWGIVESLIAKALWSRLQHATRGEQRARIIQSREYHTTAFVDLLIAGVCQADSRDDAEFTASLALQAIAAMDAPASLKHDLQARLWAEVANARRVASEWSKATAALVQARKHLDQGTGEPLLRTRAQSIAASLSADQGLRVEALAALEDCIQLYESNQAWPLVARTMVQMAHTLLDTDPGRALTVVAQAIPIIPSTDTALRCLAEFIRTDCLIDLGEIDQALQVFDQAEPLRGSNAPPTTRRRGDFLAARLLEALGRTKEAVQLFEALIAHAFDQEAYREAFLDLLYLFEVHIRRGATDKAVALCRSAVDRLDRLGLGHEQLRTVWTDLEDAAMGPAASFEALAEVREFLKVHWTTPAAKPPTFSFK